MRPLKRPHQRIEPLSEALAAWAPHITHDTGPRVTTTPPPPARETYSKTKNDAGHGLRVQSRVWVRGCMRAWVYVRTCMPGCVCMCCVRWCACVRACMLVCLCVAVTVAHHNAAFIISSKTLPQHPEGPVSPWGHRRNERATCGCKGLADRERETERKREREKRQF